MVIYLENENLLLKKKKKGGVFKFEGTHKFVYFFSKE
ncbi:hypothetical protein ES705_31660 [subsurface metagenome]